MNGGGTGLVGFSQQRTLILWRIGNADVPGASFELVCRAVGAGQRINVGYLLPPFLARGARRGNR